MTNKTPQAKNLVASPDAGSQGRRSNRGVTPQRGFVLPSPTLIMAGVIITLSLSNVILFKLYRSTADDYSTFKAEVLANQVAILRENEQKQAAADAALLAVSESWKRALDHSRRNPPVRVLHSNCDSGTSAQATGTGLKPDATAVAGLSSTAVDASRCEELINAGVRDAAQVLHLQADREALCRVYACEVSK